MFWFFRGPNADEADIGDLEVPSNPPHLIMVVRIGSVLTSWERGESRKNPRHNPQQLTTKTPLSFDPFSSRNSFQRTLV
jgi:hypothetical protein